MRLRALLVFLLAFGAISQPQSPENGDVQR